MLYSLKTPATLCAYCGISTLLDGIVVEKIIKGALVEQ